MAIARGDGDPLDTLLAGAIVQANVAEISRHADVQAAYAESDALPTDDVRRPVSMNAIASSLKLPFETVRRRVTRMAEAGYCRFVEGGVIVPAAVLAAPQYQVDGFRAYERLRAFYYQLSDLGLLRDLPPPTVELSPGVFPVRAVSRLLGAFVLRIVEEMVLIGDILDGLVLFEVFRSNTEHMPHDLRGSEGFTADDMVGDAARRPVSANAVAKRLGLPHETVRRHVATLADRGFCKRVKGGLIVPAEALARPAVAPALIASAGNLQRLFGALSQLGVLKVWDDVRATNPPAAG